MVRKTRSTSRISTAVCFGREPGRSSQSPLVGRRSWLRIRRGRGQCSGPCCHPESGTARIRSPKAPSSPAAPPGEAGSLGLPGSWSISASIFFRFEGTRACALLEQALGEASRVPQETRDSASARGWRKSMPERQAGSSSSSAPARPAPSAGETSLRTMRASKASPARPRSPMLPSRSPGRRPRFANAGADE